MTTSRVRRARWAALLAALALALAACAGGAEEPAAPSPAEQPTMESPAEEAPAEEAPAEEAPAEEAPAEGLPPVATVDNAFAPSMLEIPAGQEVTLEVVNNGQNPHTFTIDELMVDTGILESGDRATVTFTMPDTDVEFYCTVHGRAIMSGTISVG